MRQTSASAETDTFEWASSAHQTTGCFNSECRGLRREVKETIRQDRCFTWHYLTGYLNGSQASDDADTYRREAEGRYRLYTQAPVQLPPRGLIVGNLDKALLHEVVVNRISRHFLQKTVYDAIQASDAYTAAEKKALDGLLKRFEQHIFSNRADAAYNADELLAWEANLATSNHYNGHQVLDYGLLLREGIPGLLQLIQHRLQAATGSADDNAMAFYDAVQRTFAGTAAFISRHAELADRLRRSAEPGSDEESRLTRIASICRANVCGKPQHFAEGLSLLWFFVGFADYDSIGRFDQYLYPLYDRSRSEGMTREEARTLLQDFWRMLDDNGAIINMTIGGTNRDGTSAVNDLTRLVLEVTRDMRLKGPNLCIRLGGREDDALWSDLHQSLASGQALPALYNEQVIIPMLIREGIQPEDAWDFCLAGCSQIVIPGKSSFACDIGTYNTLKCLELALHDGFDRRIGKQVGPHSGAVAELDSYEAVHAACQVQFDHAIRTGVSINNKDHLLRTDFASCIRSALTADCLDSGKHLFQGGARYYAVQNEVVGLTNTANALMAIEQVVFTEKRLSLSRLVEILDQDFAGEEPLRQYLIHHVPKFGNGHSRIDMLRGQITESFFTKLSANKAPFGGRHWPGEVIFHYHVQLGQTTLASADGRRAGEPLADSAGPSQGTDRQGLAGILHSMKQIPCTTAAYPNTCCCLNLKFDLHFWQRVRDQLTLILRTFMQTGFQLQINVLNADELADALIHPENHRSLVVRVGGYSAYFTALDPAIQRDIIARTTQVSF